VHLVKPISVERLEAAIASLGMQVAVESNG
jgi:hypothetical protein